MAGAAPRPALPRVAEAPSRASDAAVGALPGSPRGAAGAGAAAVELFLLGKSLEESFLKASFNALNALIK